MKLSALLRQTQVKQIRGDLIETEDDGSHRYCAIGAIAHEIGIEDAVLTHAPIMEVIASIEARTDISFGKRFDPFVGYERHLEKTFIYLNDQQGYSFAEIANWLESEGL